MEDQEELELTPEDAILIIRADNSIELLIEDDDEEVAPQNKQIVLAIANKLQNDEQWIEELLDSLEELLDRSYH